VLEEALIRVYLAAPYAMRPEALRVRRALKQSGIGCTSRWLEDEGTISDEWAQKDFADVARCDVFVLLNAQEWSDKGTGGRHVEFGYACALRKPILLVGVRTNLFHQLVHYMATEQTPDIVVGVQRLAMAAGLT
jgi:nucleoside 2-deoxyribosyltransferase